MKKISFILSLVLLLALKGKAQFADPSIQIATIPPQFAVNTYGELYMLASNAGSTGIVTNSLEITVSVGSNTAIVGVYSIEGPTWSTTVVSSGTGNTYKFRNTQPLTGSAGANPGSIFHLQIKGTLVGGPSNMVANISYIPGPNCNINPNCPNSSVQGNLTPANDNSGTSLIVGPGCTRPDNCIPPVLSCANKFNFDQISLPPLTATNFGDFETATNFGVLVNGNPNYLHTRYESWKATTGLTASQYQFVSDPSLVPASGYLSYPALNFDGNPGKMMVVSNPPANAVVWTYTDSAKWNTVGRRQTFFDTATYRFLFSTTKVNITADPQLRLNLYNDTTTGGGLLFTRNITMTTNPGAWHRDTLTFKLPGVTLLDTLSKVKTFRIEIVSVTNIPFGLDFISMERVYPPDPYNPFPNPLLPHCLYTLRISISSFTATKLASSVLLNWKTSSESNSKNFDVQRSTDGVNWETIGTVDAAGNSSVELSYSFIDEHPVKGTNYYRLKLNDLDSRFNFSETRVVVFGGTGIGGIKVLPNPVMTRVYVTTTSSVNLQSVYVYSADGKLMQRNDQFVAGSSVDMSQMAPGTYMLKITDKQGNTEMAKVVKLNSN